MNRRTLLRLVGAGSLATGAVIGSSAFRSRDSQLGLTVEATADTNAYLGLDGCPGSPNSEYTQTDENGHLEIALSSSNPALGKGTRGVGLGVNSNATSYFHNVVQVCNQGGSSVTLWIEVPDREPPTRREGDGAKRHEPDDSTKSQPGKKARESGKKTRRDDEKAHKTVEKAGKTDERTNGRGAKLAFYVRDDPDRRVDSETDAITLHVGACTCFGFWVRVPPLEGDDRLLLDDEIVVVANAVDAKKRS